MMNINSIFDNGMLSDYIPIIIKSKNMTIVYCPKTEVYKRYTIHFNDIKTYNNINE